MLDRLKRLFIVEDPSSTVSRPAQNDVEEEEIKPVAIKQSNISNSEVKVEGKADSKFIDILLGALDKNNLEGYDYLEYKQALQSLSKVGMDEATMYKSAVAMAGTLGANKDLILKTADHYLGILKQEESKFLQALNSNKQKLAQSEQNGIATLEQGIANKQKQVENILAEIEKDKIKLNELLKEVEDSSVKIAQTAANFEAAYHLVIGQINTDVSKIKEYIN
jgi:hypothetical protein